MKAPIKMLFPTVLFIFPAMFLGVAVAMLAVIAFDVSPTVAVAIGTAAGTAAATKLLFASVAISSLRT